MLTWVCCTHAHMHVSIVQCVYTYMHGIAGAVLVVVVAVGGGLGGAGGPDLSLKRDGRAVQRPGPHCRRPGRSKLCAPKQASSWRSAFWWVPERPVQGLLSLTSGAIASLDGGPSQSSARLSPRSVSINLDLGSQICKMSASIRFLFPPSRF